MHEGGGGDILSAFSAISPATTGCRNTGKMAIAMPGLAEDKLSGSMILGTI